MAKSTTTGSTQTPAADYQSRPRAPGAPSAQRVGVFGATGSVGRSALDVIARHPDRFRANVLVAHTNVDELATLCARFAPSLAVIADPALEGELVRKLVELDVQCEVAAGAEAVALAASCALCDVVVAAIVGAAGLPSTMAAAHAGKRILLANKESAVLAGPLLLSAALTGGATVIPIDSEHSAIYQCLPSANKLFGADIKRILLTASGGPFRGRSRADLADVTPAQALAHPTWLMGPKISVDSATLMNKGLEVIEAHVLFGAPPDTIDVLIHPQSTVHSLVEFKDGSVLAQLGNPDMRTAIAHALSYPERIESGVQQLDLPSIGRLEFAKPDLHNFRCLALAYAAVKEGGDAPAILSAANEVAVDAFLSGRIKFLDIPSIIESTLEKMGTSPLVNLDEVMERSQRATETAKAGIGCHDARQ